MATKGNDWLIKTQYATEIVVILAYAKELPSHPFTAGITSILQKPNQIGILQRDVPG